MTFVKLSQEGAPVWVNGAHVEAITQHVGASGCVLKLAVSRQDGSNWLMVDENADEVARLFNGAPASLFRLPTPCESVSATGLRCDLPAGHDDSHRAPLRSAWRWVNDEPGDFVRCESLGPASGLQCTLAAGHNIGPELDMHISETGSAWGHSSRDASSERARTASLDGLQARRGGV